MNNLIISCDVELDFLAMIYIHFMLKFNLNCFVAISFLNMMNTIPIVLICFLVVVIQARDPTGSRIDLSDLQGTWSVEEYFPKRTSFQSNASFSDSPAALACESNLDVMYEISGNIWRRQSANPDRFNSNGKYYVLQAVQGDEMNYVKFRVFQDLVTEIQPCIGYVREGKVLRIQMNTTDYSSCPDKPDEYAGVCNKWIFSTATCQKGSCMSGKAKNGNGKIATGNGDGTSSTTSDGTAIWSSVTIYFGIALSILFL